MSRIRDLSDINIIIPALNSAATIGHTLESLTRQQAGSAEIIIGYNKSSDNTLEIINSYRAQLNLRIIEIPENVKGPAGARNYTAQFASSRAQWLAFTDADCRLTENWLSNIIELSASGASAITGPVTGALAENIYEKYQTLFGLNIIQEDALFDKIEIFRSFGHTANLTVLKSVFIELGGFNEKLFFAEDHDFCYRLLATGKYKLLFTNKLKIEHIFRTDFKKFIRLSFNYNKAHSYLIKKYYRNFTILFNSKKIIDFNCQTGVILKPFTLAKKLAILVCLSVFITPLFMLPLILYLLKIYNRFDLKFRDNPLIKDSELLKLFGLHLLDNFIAETGEITGVILCDK